MARDASVEPPGRRRWLYVAALLTVAAAVRVSAMFHGSLFPDEATVGLVAKHILHGENFPVFFYRQTYMGSLNGIHLVPALFAFGPSCSWSASARSRGSPDGTASSSVRAQPSTRARLPWAIALSRCRKTS